MMPKQQEEGNIDRFKNLSSYGQVLTLTFTVVRRISSLFIILFLLSLFGCTYPLSAKRGVSTSVNVIFPYDISIITTDKATQQVFIDVFSKSHIFKSVQGSSASTYDNLVIILENETFTDDITPGHDSGLNPMNWASFFSLGIVPSSVMVFTMKTSMNLRVSGIDDEIYSKDYAEKVYFALSWYGNSEARSKSHPRLRNNIALQIVEDLKQNKDMILNQVDFTIGKHYLINEKRLLKAIAYLEQAVDRHSTHDKIEFLTEARNEYAKAHGLFLEASGLLDQHEYSKATDTLEKCLYIYPHFLEAQAKLKEAKNKYVAFRINQGRICLSNSEYKKAIKHFDQALEIEPNNLQAKQLRNETKQTILNISAYERVLRYISTKDYETAYNVLTGLLPYDFRSDEVTQLYEKTRVNLAKQHENMGDTYLSQGSYIASIREYEKSLDYSQATTVDAKIAKAKRLLSSRLEEEARKQAELKRQKEEAYKVNFGQYHALIIGNNRYNNLPKLLTAENDAQSVAKLLKKNYSFHINLILNATRYTVMTELSRLRRELTPTDNLLIYYAGHGWLDQESNEGYWLPVDATMDNEVNWISNSSITTALKAMRAKHILVVADSCYSGKLVRGLKIQHRSKGYLAKIVKKRARVVISSGGLEPVADSGGKGQHSVFASAFIEALFDNDSVIDSTLLFSKIRRPVMVNSDQTPEYADIRKAGHEGGDFFFVRRN
jgi:tetratricopeptide (TPR) repeat protein